MKKISLREKLIIFAKGKYPHFINGGEFERLAMNEGFKSSNSSRRCRELVNEGIFERRENQKGCVEYRIAMVQVPIVGKIEKEVITYRPDFLQTVAQVKTKLF